MIEQLFGSKTRVKLLQLFYSNPNRSFYVREITRKIDEQINSVRRELANLLNIGIIVSDNNNNRLYYEVNQKYEYYDPLLTIFGETGSGGKAKAKKAAAGGGASEDNRLKALGHLEVMIYTGQFTRDESSGIDMLVVGDVNQNAMQKYVSELEKQEGKDIRYAVMSPTEFNYRRQIKDRFITTVLDSKKQVVVDNTGTL
jgi:hypothetical protein